MTKTSGFDADALSTELTALPHKLQTAFALLVAERLYPALIAYSRETGGDEAWRLRTFLDQIWSGLERNALDLERAREMAEEIYELRPETEDNPSSISSYALDAVGAAWEALQNVITGNPQHAVAAARIAFESVYMFQEEHEGYEPQNVVDQKAILGRNAVLDELRLERLQLERAKTFRHSPSEGVSALRREFGHVARSFHGLG